MSKQDKIEIDDAVAFFGHQHDLIAAVIYQGDLHGAQPVEAHIDASRQKLSVVFNTGKTLVEKDIVDLTPANVAMAESEHNKFLDSQRGHFNEKSGKLVEKIGFYAVDNEGGYKRDQLVNVPVLMIS